MTPDDLKAAYKHILKSEDGDVVLEDLELRFHIRTPVFSNDPYETAFRDGQRSVVLFIANMLKDKPQQVEEIELDV